MRIWFFSYNGTATATTTTTTTNDNNTAEWRETTMGTRDVYTKLTKTSCFSSLSS